MPHVRKLAAGSDSHGHVWEYDGAVVEMPHEQAEELLAIPDGGFTLADGPEEAQPVGDDGAPILPPVEQTPHPAADPEAQDSGDADGAQEQPSAESTAAPASDSDPAPAEKPAPKATARSRKTITEA
ncbi:hypothetical protein KCMC57_63920 (plasmid) [Kitasatospora sp. CMC57]|uniref:Uncharacterized protein n=1 Tax=Kitasatospora sp. CMC57 TaxID=3231513 RepID=A0AB33K8M8_9ACTN